MKKIKVFVIDDSAVVRQVLTEIFKSDSNFEFLGSASDPLFALDKMNNNWPDVIVLDIEMPRMDGLSFLKKIMSERPTPVVICSTLTTEGSDTAMFAMSLGACDIITKPKIGLKDFLNESTIELTDAVMAAAAVSLKALPSLSNQKQFTVKLDKKQDISQLQATEKLLRLEPPLGEQLPWKKSLLNCQETKHRALSLSNICLKSLQKHLPNVWIPFVKSVSEKQKMETEWLEDWPSLLQGIAI